MMQMPNPFYQCVQSKAVSFAENLNDFYGEKCQYLSHSELAGNGRSSIATRQNSTILLPPIPRADDTSLGNSIGLNTPCFAFYEYSYILKPAS
jgi:hypothetical protein